MRTRSGSNVGRQLRSAPRKLVEFLPPAIGLHARGWKNYRHMHGLDAPAKAFARLVPEGRNAVDAGANRGIYAYWMAQRAKTVYAFEPLPSAHLYLRRARIRNISAHDVALSDSEGEGTLWVPPVHGEASLVNHIGAKDAIAIAVKLRCLDDFALEDIGFMKIDVEGNELPLLRGATKTISRWRPTIFVEVEQRYHATPISEIFAYLTESMHYRSAYFWRRGDLVDLSEFRVERDQLARAGDVAAGYINNFVFSDTDLT